MHLNEPLLLTYHDQELSELENKQVQAHLAQCTVCQERLEAITRRRQQVSSRLDSLAPRPLEQPYAARAAFARFTNHSHRKISQKETIKTMFTRRTFITVLAVVAVLAMVFTIPPARAWGSSFLNMFRVQRVQVFTFDPDAIASARGQMNANRDAIEQVFEDDLEINERGPVIGVASAEEAAQHVGFAPRLPAELENTQIGVKPGMNLTFTIDQPKHQALIDATGVDIDLPADLDGSVITVDVPDSVTVLAGCEPMEDRKEAAETCINFVQMPSPVINAPDGLDVAAMGEAMFIFLGVSPDEARQLSQRIDWTSTLVLPIPADENISYQDVQVDGVTGSLLQENNQNHSMLIWVKDGILYGLSVPGPAQEAFDIASTLR